MLTSSANKVVLTHNRVSVGRQPPDAGPFEIEGDCRRLGNGTERLGDIGLVAPGKLEERLLSTPCHRAVALIGRSHMGLGLRCPHSDPPGTSSSALEPSHSSNIVRR